MAPFKLITLVTVTLVAYYPSLKQEKPQEFEVKRK